jgi:hypothetical protein
MGQCEIVATSWHEYTRVVSSIPFPSQNNERSNLTSILCLPLALLEGARTCYLESSILAIAKSVIVGAHSCWDSFLLLWNFLL